MEAGGEKYAPSQIGAFVLGKMKETAEAYLGSVLEARHPIYIFTYVIALRL